jgi:DNA-binding NarL/FixJ family response regulator
MKRITVLLVEDHQIVREGLRGLLAQDPDLELVGEAEDGRAAVAMALRLRPAVVLMDIAMPRMNGLEATRQVLKALPATRVIILSAHSDEAYVANAAAAGAAGFLLKQSSAHVVCRAVREVRAGGAFFSPPRAGMDARQPARGHAAAPTLTAREMEVLQLVAEGRANKETAVELGIGVKTVEKHREHLMKKLRIHDTAGLTRYAIAAGIIESSVQVTIV